MVWAGAPVGETKKGLAAVPVNRPMLEGLANSYARRLYRTSAVRSIRSPSPCRIRPYTLWRSREGMRSAPSETDVRLVAPASKSAGDWAEPEALGRIAYCEPKPPTAGLKATILPGEPNRLRRSVP